MKKRIISLCMVVCLLAVAIVGGTMAYFTDTSDVASNVMTIGEVSIKQEEFHGDLKTPFVDEDIIVLPGKVAATPAESTNVIDKVVKVTNTGDTAAYVRTIILFENTKGSKGDGSDGIGAKGTFWKYLPTQSEVQYGSDLINIDGTNYWVLCLTSVEAVQPEGEYVSLYNFCFNETVTEADFAECGDTYDVKVLSQAIQVIEGANDGKTWAAAEAYMNEAIGEMSDANIQAWFATTNP